MGVELRNREGRNRVKRGATPARPVPTRPLFALPDFGPLMVRFKGVPWRGVGLALLVPALLVVLVQGMNTALQRLDRNVGVIEISGTFDNLTQDALQEQLVYLTDESFFAVDLEEAQRRLESLPWVESSRVQRVWPNKLQFWVEEREPIALWGETGLLSRTGEVFEPEDRTSYAHLPALNGPEGSQESVWLNYVRWSQEFAPLGLQVAGIYLAPRGAWELTMQGGILIKLGRDDLHGKMARLQKIFRAQLQDKIPEIEILDVRYANGLAVRWKEQTNNG